VNLLATDDKKDGIIRTYLSWPEDTERRNTKHKQQRKEIWPRYGVMRTFAALKQVILERDVFLAPHESEGIY